MHVYIFLIYLQKIQINTRVFAVLADEPRKFIDGKRMLTLSQGVVHVLCTCVNSLA